MATRGADRFLLEFEHPLERELETVRCLLLDADPAIEEGIKWNAPSFRVNEYFATLNLRTKDAVQIIFHLGAKARPDIVERIAVADPRNLLEWLGKDRASVKLAGRAEIESEGKTLQDVVRHWITHLK